MTAQQPDPVAADAASLLEGNALARTEFARAIAGLSQADRSDPWLDGWSLHEIVGHLAAWEDGFAAALELAVAGERPQVPGYDSSVDDATDRFNEDVTAALAGVRWDGLLIRLELAAERHDAALRSVVGALTPERFEVGRSARRLATASNHYEEHIPQILEWRERTGRSLP